MFGLRPWLVTMCWFWIGCTRLRSDAQINSENVCGFPGEPAYGLLKPSKDVYKTNEQVRYECLRGYELAGPPINECQRDGVWMHKDPPVCLKNAAFQRPATQSSTVTNFHASLAVDNNISTCSETLRITSSQPSSHRPKINYNFWEVLLNSTVKIGKVSVRGIVVSNFYNLSVQLLNKSSSGVYHPCGRKSAKAVSQVIEDDFYCSNDSVSFSGSIVRIVDLRGYGALRLCEVKIRLKEPFECGRPNVQPNCEVREIKRNGLHSAIYSAKPGFRILQGETQRYCSDGKWKDEATPVCVGVGPAGTSPSSNSSSNEQKSDEKKKSILEDNVVVGIAIGVTAASISTIIVIVVVVIIMRKYYRRCPQQTTTSDVHEGVFLGNSPSSCGSGSPKIRQTYSDPWDDPSTHMYDYINPETLMCNRAKAETSFSKPSPKIDGEGYLIRRNNPEDADPSTRESLIEPVTLREYDRRRLPEPVLSPVLYPENRVHSVNELEVDAYGYPDSEDQCRM